MKGKKADVTITTVILVIAGVVVLALLIFWLVGGSTQFGDWIGNLFGNENAGTLASTCQASCEIDKYNYCNQKKDLRFKDSNDKLLRTKITCFDLKKGGPRKIDGETVQLPIVDINCGTNCEEGGKTCNDWDGAWQDDACDATDQNDKTSDALDKAANSEKSCCVDKTCKGTVTQCKDITLPNCNAQEGCKLDNTCIDDTTGGALACTNSKFNTEILCEGQIGCSWI